MSKLSGLYSIININLSSSRIDESFPIDGQVLYILDAPASIDASVKFDESDRDPIEIVKGRRYQLPFDRFLITSSAQSGVLTIIVGKNPEIDFSESGNDINQIVQPIFSKGVNTLSAAVVNITAAATQIVAANSLRRALTIKNEGSNPCRIGKSDVTYAANGLLLEPGDGYEFQYTGGIYAICNAALSTNLSYIEEYSV